MKSLFYILKIQFHQGRPPKYHHKPKRTSDEARNCPNVSYAGVNTKPANVWAKERHLCSFSRQFNGGKGHVIPRYHQFEEFVRTCGQIVPCRSPIPPDRLKTRSPLPPREHEHVWWAAKAKAASSSCRASLTINTLFMSDEYRLTSVPSKPTTPHVFHEEISHTTVGRAHEKRTKTQPSCHGRR